MIFFFDTNEPDQKYWFALKEISFSCSFVFISTWGNAMFYFPKCWLLHLFLERILPLLFLSPWSVSVLRLIRPTFVMMKKGCWLEKKSQAGLRLIFFGKVYWGQLAAGKIFILGNSSKVNSSIRPLNLFFFIFLEEGNVSALLRPSLCSST